jgi:hypothetical protein
MSSSKANIAGLASPQQQSEMKCLLAGTWPPLKPLPVFKYEFSDYRATIDFDKLRGEWVCRKTSFPSNKVQELRGELREITLALPHAKPEMLADDVGDQEHELEKDTTRRLQAIQAWKENYENGARYFELRNYLWQTQRAEMEESLRLSLTARQLQFSARNVSSVFDALSTAGGRFAALLEFAKRNKARQGTSTDPPSEQNLPDPDPAFDDANPSREISTHEFLLSLGPDHSPVRQEETQEPSTAPEVPPTLLVRNIVHEPYQPPSLERITGAAPELFESESPDPLHADSSSFLEEPYQLEHIAPPSVALAAQLPSDSSSAPPSTHLPALEISVFQVTLFASLILCVVVAFAVGLTMGRGPVGSRLRQLPESVLGPVVASPTPPRQPVQSASPTPSTAAVPSGTSVANSQPTAATPLKQIPPAEPGSSPQPQATSDPSTAAVPVERPLPPPASRPLHLVRSAGTFVISLPHRIGQPFRITLPEKTIAANSSFAMAAQLSVLVPPDPEPLASQKPTRLEAGQLVSFVWPRYPKPRSGLAEVIRVRAAISSLGQVQDVEFLSGSSSLLPATARAIRQWHYTPTLWDKKPVPSQQDLTIAFRPRSYSSQTTDRHSPHKPLAAN